MTPYRIPRVVLASGILFLATLSTLATRTSTASTNSSPALPDGWYSAGLSPDDYDMGTDPKTAHAGKASGYLRAKVAKPSNFGTLMQTCGTGEFLGKRVRMSAWIKSEQVTDWAGLWMRVDAGARPIKGTTGWSQYQIVLDVAPEAKDIAFGILLDGPGAVWIDEIKFEVVDSSVPTTGGDALAEAPQNLSFEK
jgi:hypothetical protein